MDDFWKRYRRQARNSPRRLYHAIPSVLLGTLFNILDAVSTGLLIFPTRDGGKTFESLQIQGISMYIMSTILSQVAMTLGGSGFSGGLGAMLIEILPFLRGIASDIRQVLGDDDPALVPTIMVAYAMTSFLTGICFMSLGLMRAGRLVSYFPQTVLIGAIGGIGVSLFILGLGLPFPPSADSITLSNVRRVLFDVGHLPLLFASCGPALFLSISIRSETFRRWSFGATQHAYYVPVYLAFMPILFWMIVAGLHLATADGMHLLVSKGWLFQLDSSTSPGSGLGTAWIYWELFDFNRIKIHALSNATTNIVLLVVIGVLNLPIYVPALGIALDMPFDMNHEFLGQGAANLLAGIAGTVPNVLQLSYSIFFTRAGGGRLEAGIVTVLTFVLFLVASLLLPYVPTVLASALVLFLGIELTLEAVWESAKTMLHAEFFVVIATLIACTFLGFAPGFGVGIAAAAVVYMIWGVVDSRAKLLDTTAVVSGSLGQTSHQPFRGTAHSRAEPLYHSLSDKATTDTEAQLAATTGNHEIRIIELLGYVFFATIPSLEKMIDRSQEKSSNRMLIVIDMTRVHRVETSAVQLLERKAKELENATLAICGVGAHSGVYNDFKRGGLNLVPAPRYCRSDLEQNRDLLCFASRNEVLRWRELVEDDESSQISEDLGSTDSIAKDEEDILSPEDAIHAFSKQFGYEGSVEKVVESLPPSLLDSLNQPKAFSISSLECLRQAGIFARRVDPGTVLTVKGEPLNRVYFVVSGSVTLEDFKSRAVPRSRLSVRAAVLQCTGELITRLKARRRPVPPSAAAKVTVGRIDAGNAFGPLEENMQDNGREAESTWTASDRVRASEGQSCWLVEVLEGECGERWPQMREWAMSVTSRTKSPLV